AGDAKAAEDSERAEVAEGAEVAGPEDFDAGVFDVEGSGGEVDEAYDLGRRFTRTYNLASEINETRKNLLENNYDSKIGAYLGDYILCLLLEKPTEQQKILTRLACVNYEKGYKRLRRHLKDIHDGNVKDSPWKTQVRNILGGAKKIPGHIFA